MHLKQCSFLHTFEDIVLDNQRAIKAHVQDFKKRNLILKYYYGVYSVLFYLLDGVPTMISVSQVVEV